MDGVVYMVNRDGYSGKDKGKNNPSMQDVKNTGPIPQGSYVVGPNVPKTPKGLKNARPLTPMTRTNTFGRSEFFIHGENPNRNPGTSSEGCPIIRKENRSLIPNGEIFNVIP